MKSPRSIYLSIVFIILVGFVPGCDDTLLPKQQSFPFIATNKATDITTSGVVFHGEVLRTGTDEIIDHGFVWAEHPLPVIEFDRKYSIGPEITDFSANVTYDLRADKEYSVRAYVRTAKNLIYGDVEKVTSLGSIPAVITSFSPKEGIDGDTITIEGENFSTVGDLNILRFTSPPNVGATVIGESHKKITAIVPGATAGSQKLSISTSSNSGVVTMSAENFLVKNPLISSFSPTNGTRDVTEITINGYFSRNPAYNKVYFGGTQAVIVSSSQTKIVARVPNRPTGLVKITVNVNSKTGQSTTDFLVE